MKMSFEAELRRLINSHSMENDSDSPDYVLASFMANCLDAFNWAVRARDEYHGFEPFKHEKVSYPINTDEYRWRSADTEKPSAGLIVEVELENAEIKKAKYDHDVNRTCWLIEGAAGLYMRSLVNNVKRWRKIQP